MPSDFRRPLLNGDQGCDTVELVTMDMVPPPRRTSNRCQCEVRRTIIELLEYPFSSKPAFCVCSFVLLLIIFSSVCFVVETIPSVYAMDLPFFEVVEAVSIVIFTLEFILRFIGYLPHFRIFFSNLFNYVDLLSILPFYIEIVMTAVMASYSRKVDMRIVRMVRLARVFRMFRLARYSRTLRDAINALKKSCYALLFLAVFLMISLCVFASVMWYMERGTWDSLTGQWILDDGSPRSGVALLVLPQVEY